LTADEGTGVAEALPVRTAPDEDAAGCGVLVAGGGDGDADAGDDVTEGDGGAAAEEDATERDCDAAVGEDATEGAGDAAAGAAATEEGDGDAAAGLPALVGSGAVFVAWVGLAAVGAGLDSVWTVAAVLTGDLVWTVETGEADVTAVGGVVVRPLAVDDELVAATIGCDAALGVALCPALFAAPSAGLGFTGAAEGTGLVLGAGAPCASVAG
jgi:hypothetical protein